MSRKNAERIAQIQKRLQEEDVTFVESGALDNKTLEEILLSPVEGRYSADAKDKKRTYSNCLHCLISINLSKNVSLLKAIIETCDPAQFLQALSMHDTWTTDLGDALHRLVCSLSIAVEKHPDGVAERTTLIKMIFDKYDFKELMKVLSANRETDLNAFFQLIDTLYWAVQYDRSAHIVENIANLIQTIFDKHDDPKKLSEILIVKTITENLSRKNAVYELMDVLHQAAKKNDTKSVAVIAKLIITLFEKCDPLQLVENLATPMTGAGDHPLLQMLEALRYLGKKDIAIATNITTAFFDTLAKIDFASLTDKMKSKVKDKIFKKGILYNHLMSYLSQPKFVATQTSADMMKLQEITSPTTMLGALIDHHRFEHESTEPTKTRRWVIERLKYFGEHPLLQPIQATTQTVPAAEYARDTTTESVIENLDALIQDMIDVKEQPEIIWDIFKTQVDMIRKNSEQRTETNAQHTVLQSIANKIYEYEDKIKTQSTAPQSAESLQFSSEPEILPPPAYEELLPPSYEEARTPPPSYAETTKKNSTTTQPAPSQQPVSHTTTTTTTAYTQKFFQPTQEQIEQEEMFLILVRKEYGELAITKKLNPDTLSMVNWRDFIKHYVANGDEEEAKRILKHLVDAAKTKCQLQQREVPNAEFTPQQTTPTTEKESTATTPEKRRETIQKL